jgi:hypothetical protein
MLKNNEKSFEIIVAIIVCLAVVGVARADAPYIVVDNFETYSGDSDLRAVWEDRHTLPEQGGETYLQLASSDPCLVHYGNQSLHFEYDWQYGTPVTRRTYSAPQDWTVGRVAALDIWFYGDANYAGDIADGMYVTLGDDDNSDGVVDDQWTIFYDGDVNNLAAKEWMVWHLSLQDFNDANDVNPDKIKSIAMGVTGGTIGVHEIGQIYFDDMRLYVPRCRPEYSWQYGDLYGDCIIDYEDLIIMADEWLTSGIKADLIDDDNVNFKDYAVLANNWLEEFLWP